ncbi:MAG: B12-binding domain-containing radical SAM protein, partial [Geobacteraceae bacterium]|nr:B12-binding domain-containing radical SAM protein [Geobacteraceae bacterium]
SYGASELLEQNPAIDCIVRGEGEETFRELVAALARTGGGRDALPCVSTGMTFRCGDGIVATPERPPITELDAIPSPFAVGLADLAKPLVYFETSRGCPFSCAFCMSSLEKGVRSFSMGRIEADLRLLMERGAQTVKLVDRTFNYDPQRADRIWQFILAHNRGSRFHFEIAADLLTEDNLRLLERVPAGMFRFEIGVQSGSEETLARVGRRSDLAGLFANVRRLVATTGVTVHLDLVAGLPREDFAGFLASLQTLLELDPQHIQVEPLKVLKGSAMRQIALEEGYAFSDAPPYKILHTPWLTFPEVCRIEGVARLLDLVYNSGRFGATLKALAETAPLAPVLSRFARFREEEGTDGPLSREALFELVWRFAGSETAGERREAVREALCYDYCLADYPAGRLPVFFCGSCAPARLERGELEQIGQRLGVEGGSRVRGFSRRFARDFRRHPWQGGELELLFVYISAPGRGLRVEVLESAKCKL